MTTDSELIKAVGSELVRNHFGLSHQGLHNWRKRGIPLGSRAAFGALASDRGVTLPVDFMAPIEARIARLTGEAA